MTNETTNKTRPPSIVINDNALPDEPKQGEPVDVDSSTTPITRQEITTVDALRWDQMSIAQLHEQLSTLENRLFYAQRIGHAEMVQQLARGIHELRALIETKHRGL